MRTLLILLALATAGQNALAQTYKSIHRSDGPAVRIPVHLIDTVRTLSNVDGDLLSVQLTSGETTQIPLALIDSITHREGSVVDPSELGAIDYGSVMGVVTDHTGNAVADAVVYAGFSSEQTVTDTNGVFFLDSIAVYGRLGLIRVVKDGYFQGSRSFLPIDGGRNLVKIQLSPRVQIGSFQTASGGTVATDGLSVLFPPNAITRDGQPYTGQVNVYATVFDPTEPFFNDRMPGDLIGGMNDSLQMLRSFGMADVEITDGAGVPVQIASGSEATLTLNVPDTMLAEAPAQIDFWSFDTELGYWMHEGEASLNGNTYVGQAAHFTPWNVDVPITPVDLTVDCTDNEGRPIVGGRLTASLAPGNPTAFTNAEGRATIRVRRGSAHTLNLSMYCPVSATWQTISTQSVPALSAAATTAMTGQLPGTYRVSGTVTDCEGNPVRSGYVVSNGASDIAFLHEGAFGLRVCDVGQIVIRAFQTFADSVKVSQPVTVSVGAQGAVVDAIAVCDGIEGSVVDQDGNTYATIVIGTQEWMAENLRTTTYRNGDPIPNVTDNTQWQGLTTGAWAHYNHDSQYENPYGKLYNGYAVNDPRNVCPVGWHVPSEAEWNTLIGYLDPDYNPEASGGGMPHSSTAGGVMKSTGTQYWNAPNEGATNVSGFSGVGSGLINFYGSHTLMGRQMDWWSSSAICTGPTGPECYRTRGLDSETSWVYRKGAQWRYGLPIRCLRD
jgi:uncharacterized protein (TIGR02145 family)